MREAQVRPSGVTTAYPLEWLSHSWPCQALVKVIIGTDIHYWWEFKWKSYYWVDQNIHSIFSVKEKTHFSFSQISLLIWIFWVCWLSHNVDCSQLMSWFHCYQLQLVYLTVEQRSARNLWHKTSQTTFDMFDQSQHLLYTLQKSFFVFQLCFYFSWVIKCNMPKCCIFSSIFNIKMAPQKFTNFAKFF